MGKSDSLWRRVGNSAELLAEHGAGLLMKARKMTYRVALKEAQAVGGVYAVWNGRTLMYVGESVDLRRRFNSLKDPRGHILRKSLGRDRFTSRIQADGKFPARIEGKLDDFLFEKCRYAFLPVGFGRKEVEKWAIRTRNPEHKKGKAG